MHESAALFDLLSKGSTAAVLMVAVWYVAKRLASAYESRIQALERLSEACERDRVDLRNMMLRALADKTGSSLTIPPK